MRPVVTPQASRYCTGCNAVVMTLSPTFQYTEALAVPQTGRCSAEVSITCPGTRVCMVHVTTRLEAVERLGKGLLLRPERLTASAAVVLEIRHQEVTLDPFT